jgi:hypothetical protein
MLFIIPSWMRVPHLAGRSGTPCLVYYLRQLRHNILLSSSKVCKAFYINLFRLFFSNETIVSGVHFIVTIIRRSLFCILLITSSRFHIIIVWFLPVIEDNLRHQETGLKLQEYSRIPVHCLGLRHPPRPSETNNALLARTVSYISHTRTA